MKNTHVVLPFLWTLHIIGLVGFCILGILFWIFSPLFILHVPPHFRQTIEQETDIQNLHRLAQQLVKQLEYAYTTNRNLVSLYCFGVIGLFLLFLINTIYVHQTVLRTTTGEKHLPHLGHGMVLSLAVLFYVMVSYPSTPIFNIPA